MSEVNLLECPNCGSTDFVEVAPRKHRCAYCGTTLTLPETKPKLVQCPRCGFENERGVRYCNNCGASLVSWARPFARAKRDPALTSILVTAIGSFFVPLVGAIVGLVLAYRALREARAGGGGSEKLARIAVIVGWCGVVLGLLPLCITVITSGAQVGYSLCNELFQALPDVLMGGGGG